MDKPSQTNRRKPPASRADHIEPIVKITVSPNTPSPEPHDDSETTSVYSEAGIVVAGTESSRNHHKNISTKSFQDNNKKTKRGGESSVVDGQSNSQPWNDLNLYSQTIPVCIDFGIQDYLCRADEADLDLSSDTDTSYLGATPPHRFSDGEIDPIEAMPVLLDTQLNIKDDDNSSLATMASGSMSSSNSSAGTPGTLTNVDEAVESDVPLKTTFNWRETNFQTFLAKSLSKESLISLHISSSVPADGDSTLAIPGSSHLPFNKMKKTLQDAHLVSRPVLPRPFRRNVSLPATIFKSYLIEIEQSTKNQNQKPEGLSKRKFSEHSSPIPFSVDGDDNNVDPLFNSNSVSSLKTVGARLNKIDSISNSSQINLYDDDNNDNSFGDSFESRTASMDRASADLHDDGDSSWNISNSIDSEVDDHDPPFMSDIEKRSIIIRHMRRKFLIRQDTTGNFAPPDYHI